MNIMDNYDLVCLCVLVTQSCPTLCNHMDCNPPGSFVHGTLQARILEWEPFPSPGYLPNPGIEPGFSALLLETSLVTQMVKRLPTMRETWVQSLGREDLLDKAMATHSSTLAWKIPWTEEPGRLQSIGSLRVRHDWATSLSCIGEGNGNPLQCSCLENPRDRGAWWAAVYGVAQSQT